MEAVWKLEEKWKLSTEEAVILFVCTAFVVVGVCTATALRKMRGEKKAVEGVESGRWRRVKAALMGSVRWSKPNKWSRKEQPAPLLGGGGGESGWPSHNSVSPVWQRPILMGGKCEFPRFSGLILYDESGKPLDHDVNSHNVLTPHLQGPPAVRITLRDLL